MKYALLAVVILPGVPVILSKKAHVFKRILSHGNMMPLHRVLLTLFLICAGLNTVKALRIITTNADTSYPESAMVQTARWASQSGRFYPFLDAAPYTPAPYGPLLYLALAGAGKVADGDAYRVRLLLRSVVFVSYLLCGLVGYLLARRAKASKNVSILAAAAILGVPFALNWNVTIRPDFPGLLLSLSGIWIISRREQPTLRAGVLAGVCCAGALLMKQPFVAASFAIALSFVFRRSYHHLAAFAVGASVTASLVIGYLWLRGEPVIKGMLVISHSPLAPKSGLLYLYHDLSVGLGALVVAGGFAGFLSAFGTSRWRVRLLGWYFLFAMLVALVTLLQVGSNNNYLLEMWSIAAILAASAVPQSEAIWAGLSQPIRIGATIAVLFLTAQSIRAISHSPAVTEYNTARLEGLRVLSTDPFLSIHGRNPELLDPFLTTILEQQQKWSTSGILGEIGRQEFDVVFTNQTNRELLSYHGQPILSSAVLQSLAQSYRPLCRTSTMLVMLPRERAPFSLSDASYTLREACEAIVPPQIEGEEALNRVNCARARW